MSIISQCINPVPDHNPTEHSNLPLGGLPVTRPPVFEKSNCRDCRFGKEQNVSQNAHH